MALHIRSVFERNEGNSVLKGGLMELCSREGLLGVHLKSHNVLHRL